MTTSTCTASSHLETIAAAKPPSPPVKALVADAQSNVPPPEGIWKPTPQLSRLSDVLHYAVDPANCVSLAGAACGFLSLAASVEGAMDRGTLIVISRRPYAPIPPLSPPYCSCGHLFAMALLRARETAPIGGGSAKLERFC